MLDKSIKDFSKMINNLEESLKQKRDEFMRDSAIKRFELCFDLAWKSIKNYAKKQGVECYSPGQCFKETYQLQLIDYEQEWMNMIKDRNLPTHHYDENNADEIYNRMDKYLGMFKDLLERLR